MKYISNAMMMMMMMIKIQFIKSFSRGTKKNSSNTRQQKSKRQIDNDDTNLLNSRAAISIPR
jgi:hypothetical protein